MSEETLNQIKNVVKDFLIDYGPTMLLALVMLIIGIIAIKFITRFVSKFLKKNDFDLSLTGFIVSMIKISLYVLLIVTVGSTLGIASSSFIAVIGAAGLAVGLALQGSLSNFAGGVLILFFKPFRVNDLIYVDGTLGRVNSIDILYTKMITFDNRVITMPNGNLSNNNVENHTMLDMRRIDMKIKLSYNSDIKKTREVVVNTLKQHPKVFKEPAPDLWVDEFGEYDIKIATRCWVEPEDYWPTYWEQLEAIKEALDREGIIIPIPRSHVSYSREGQ